MRKIWMRLRAALIRPEVDREMDAELSDHLEHEAQDLMARGGYSEAEARRIAAESMGRLEQIRQECRDSRGTQAWERLRQDVWFGARVLWRRNPALALTTLATVTLGIGSTTAVFSVVDQVLIRPLAFADPSRLMAVEEIGMRGPFDALRSGTRLADYAAYATELRSFNGQGRDWPERLNGCEVSANFFEVIGARPALGRTFQAGEDRGGVRRIVLSHDYWVRRQGARADVAGRQIWLDSVAYEVAGVMPREFRFPFKEADFWVPLRVDPRQAGEFWGAGGIFTFARLRPGVSVQAAEAELRAWVPRILQMFPWRMPDAWAQGARLLPLQERLVEGVRARSLLLLGSVALLLVIAVVNSASLLAAQAAARQREFALRVCLGATDGRLFRQWLTEGLVMGLSAALLGAALAYGQIALLKQLLPPDTPRLEEVNLDGRALACSIAISLACSLVFGLWPAWRMRGQMRAAVDGRGSAQADAWLVGGEAAIATVLLVGAGLMGRSLWMMSQVDPGFGGAESLITAELNPNPELRASRAKTALMLDALRAQVTAQPGVTNMAALSTLPLTRNASTFAAAIEDRPLPPQAPQYVLWFNAVTPEHLDTFGLKVLEGRGFTTADRRDAPGAVLVSKATAAHFWPNRSAIGRRLKPVWDREWRTVVGVVSDAKNYELTGRPEWINGEVYLPMAQALNVPPAIALVVKVAGEAGRSIEAALPRLVAEQCPGCAVSKIASMQRVVTAVSDAPRSTAWLVGCFALFALAMVGAGVYGVVSQSVARRMKELGIRLALGGSRVQVVWPVLSGMLWSALAGSAAGLCAAWALSRWIEGLLFGVARLDPVSFSAAPLAIAAAALAASAVPVARALRADPVRWLREG